MMPPGAVPPELVDMPVSAPIDDMLRPLDVEDVASRLVARQWGTGDGGQVDMVPPLGVAPELVDMTIDPQEVDMPGPLGGEPISSRRADSDGRARGGGQIAMVPPAGVPPQLVDMAVPSLVDDVLRTLSREFVTPRNGDRQWRAGGGGQIAMMPAVAVPPQLVDVTIVPSIRAEPLIDDVLRVLSREYVAARIEGRQGRIHFGGQVVMVPPSVPVEFVDVPVSPSSGSEPLVEDMLRILSREYVARRAERGQW